MGTALSPTEIQIRPIERMPLGQWIGASTQMASATVAPPSASASFAGRVNNFDLLRLFAALQVLFQHGTFHLGVRPRGPVVGVVSALLFYFPGVPIFFVMSGFLVSLAYERAGGWRTYAIHRVLRIFPALWTCFAVTLVVLAVTGELTATRLRTGEFWLWVVAQTTVAQCFNPAMWRHIGVGVVNGSLWTIPVELQFYAVLPLLYRWCVDGRSRRGSTLTLAALATASFLMWCVLQSHVGALTVGDKLVQVSLAPHLFLFLLGALMRRHWSSLAPWVVNRAPVWIGIYVALRLLWAVPLASPARMSDVIAWSGAGLAFLLLAVSTIALAYTLPTLSGRLLRGTDLSYGIYLYHMLVINALLLMGWGHGTPTFVIAAGATVLLAALSWQMVEAPARRAKRAVISTLAEPAP